LIVFDELFLTMKVSNRIQDRILFLFLIGLVIGIPLLIKGYDRYVWQEKIQPETKVFALTGHIDKGWVAGDVKAFQVASLQPEDFKLEHPVIRVHKGDKVVLKLTSSDVIHGFSLKDFGVYVEEGIVPGKVTLVSFVADREGTFTFTCNAICGKNHDKMQGTLIVTT